MPNHREALSYILDLHNKQVLIRIPFDLFLTHTNPNEGMTIFPEQMDFLKREIEDAILESNNENTPSN